MVQTEMFAAIAAIRPRALDSFASTRPALFRLRHELARVCLQRDPGSAAYGGGGFLSELRAGFQVGRRSEAYRLRAASPIRATSSRSIAGAVAKLSRANPA